MVVYLFYRKKAFSRVYTKFKSFIPERYKIGLIKSLLFRCFSLCFDFIQFHDEIDKLKSILYKNSYPRDLVNKCIKEVLAKILAPKPVASTERFWKARCTIDVEGETWL